MVAPQLLRGTFGATSLTRKSHMQHALEHSLYQLASTQRRLISVYGYEQAKALVYSQYGEPEKVLILHTHSISPAHSSLMTVRFLASPVNPADINQIQGTYPSKPSFTTNLSTAAPSAVPGNEGVAEVLAAGSGASTSSSTSSDRKVKKGDWVIMKTPGFGTWRTHAQATGEDFLKLDESDREGISAVQAGTVSVNPCTAYAMLKGWIGGGHSRRNLKAGSWFVQNGANSGVGRAAIQLGRVWGLKSLNIIRARPGGEGETNALKDELKSIGGDVVVTEDEVQENGFGDRVKEWTNGGRDEIGLALNCVGGRSALSLAKVLGRCGWHVTYGAMAKQPLSLPAGMLIFKDLRFAGFWVSDWSKQEPAKKETAVKEIFSLIRSGNFVDSPVQEIMWDLNTEQEMLKETIQGTLDGFRGGKRVFLFGRT